MVNKKSKYQKKISAQPLEYLPIAIKMQLTKHRRLQVIPPEIGSDSNSELYFKLIHKMLKRVCIRRKKIFTGQRITCQKLSTYA